MSHALTTQSAETPRVGHVHLKVADLDRAAAFYRDVLAYAETARVGYRAAFLGAAGRDVTKLNQNRG